MNPSDVVYPEHNILRAHQSGFVRAKLVHEKRRAIKRRRFAVFRTINCREQLISDQGWLERVLKTANRLRFLTLGCFIHKL